MINNGFFEEIGFDSCVFEEGKKRKKEERERERKKERERERESTGARSQIDETRHKVGPIRLSKIKKCHITLFL